MIFRLLIFLTALLDQRLWYVSPEPLKLVILLIHYVDTMCILTSAIIDFNGVLIYIHRYLVTCYTN